MTARGVIVDILSRPDHWKTNSDTMWKRGRRDGPPEAEGRRMMRSAFALLKEVGYMVEVKERNADGTYDTVLHAYDTTDANRGTASGTPAVTIGERDDTAGGNRGTAYGPSVGGTSIERQRTKTEESNQAASPDAFASGMEVEAASQPPIRDDADASSATAGAAAREDDRQAGSANTARRPESLDRRLDRHLRDLGADAVDEMYQDLANDRGIIDWATDAAIRNLGLPLDADPDDEPSGTLTREAVAIALMRLTKPNGGGLTPTVEDLLGDFEWPETRRESPRKQVADKPSRPRTDYFPIAEGADPNMVLHALYAGVNALRPDGRAAIAARFREGKPRIFQECEAAAREQFEDAGATPTPDALTALTIQYGQRHYSGNWPTYLVPDAMKPQAAKSKAS